MTTNTIHFPLSNTCYRTSTMQIPSEGDIEIMASDLEWTEKFFSLASPTACKSIKAWLISDPVNNRNYGSLDREIMKHKLSSLSTTLRVPKVLYGKSLSEFEILQASPCLIGNIDNHVKFMDMLSHFHKLIIGHNTSFRSSAVFTEKDKNGNYVAYPAPHEIRRQLRKIWKFWFTCLNRKLYAVAALVTLVGLSNIHPFADGNGRLSRVVFNWTMNADRTEKVYLPIYETSALSEDGYLLRIKEASYFGQWSPIAKYIAYISKSLLNLPIDRPNASQ